MGNGIRQRQMTPAQAAVAKQRQAEDRAIKARIEADTCGLGYWERPSGWDCGSVEFSHTVTMTDGLSGGCDSAWMLYSGGVVVALVVHEGPYERGAPYVWCKTTRNGNGDPGGFPTAPIFGRFIEAAPSGRPVALVSRAKSREIDATFDQCFRPVGRVGPGSEFFQRSEVPVPVPSATVREQLPSAFNWLQSATKMVDDTLGAMASVVDMVTEANDAEAEKPGDDSAKYRSRVDRQSSAFEALDVMLCTLMRRHSNVREALATFHERSPELAYWLKRWQADNRAARSQVEA
jgi:hypothetical protein